MPGTFDIWVDGQPLLAESDGTLDVWCDGAPVVAYAPPAAGGETLEIFVHDCTDTLESLH